MYEKLGCSHIKRPFLLFCLCARTICRIRILLIYVQSYQKYGFPILSSLLITLSRRFKATDISSNVSKAVPDFCNVYVISTKGKISSTRSASRQAPAVSPLRNQIQYQAQIKSDSVTPLAPCISTRG